MSEEEKIETPSEEVKEETATEQPTEETTTEETPSEPQEETPAEEVTEEETQEEVKEESLENLDPKTIEQSKVTDILQGKGFDYAELQKEFNETGDLSKDTRDKLSQSGISEEMLDNYIEGQKARVEKEIDEISQCVGGREKMTEVIKWAAENLTDEEKMSINGVTDKNLMMIVLENLKGRMEEKEGKLPEAQIEGEGTKTTIDVYKSQAQMLEAIRDSRYKTDEAYRAEVLEKIHASREAGIDLGI